MTADLYDLALRLRAAHDGHPVRRTAYAHTLPPLHPIAIRTHTTGHDGTAEIALHATSNGTTTHGTGPTALTALTALGLDLTVSHRTLVVATTNDLTNLASLARHHGDEDAAAAATIAWWLTRADHPGTGAVLVLTDALTTHYATAAAPAADRRLRTWTDALTTPDDGTDPTVLLALAATITDPTTPALPGLVEARNADQRSWTYHRDRTLAGRPWSLRDSRRQAALGLATRCDAADLYTSQRLTDPLLAIAHAHTGDVVHGTITDVTRNTITLAATRPLSRLRPGSDLTGWYGQPVDVATAAHRLTRGTLDTATITAAGALTITVTDTISRPHAPTVGQPITLVARPADPNQQSRGRSNTAARYRRPENWIANGTAPEPRRRDVPLDVVIAAAD